MINQLCTFPKCANLTSVTTHPYCHEHANQKSRRPHSTPRIFSVDQEPVLHPQTQGVRETERHSFDEGTFHQQGRGQPCVEQGCEMYGLPEWGNRCSHHHRAKPSGKATSPKAAESWQPCRQAGCESHGSAHYTGYCSTCYTACNKTKRPAQVVKPVPSSENLASSLSSSTLSSGTSIRHETRQCIGPNCSNPGSDTYNGLCDDCYTIILQQKTAATGSGVPQRKLRISAEDRKSEQNL